LRRQSQERHAFWGVRERSRVGTAVAFSRGEGVLGPEVRNSGRAAPCATFPEIGIDRDNTDERQARVDRMIEEFRADQKRRLVREG